MIFLYSLIIFALMFALGALAYSYRKSHAGSVGDHLLDEEPYVAKPREVERPRDETYKKELDTANSDDESNHPKIQ